MFCEESFYESWATYEKLSHIFVNGGDLFSQIKNHLCFLKMYIIMRQIKL